MGHIAGLPDGTVASLIFSPVAKGQTDVDLVPASPFSDLTGGTVPVSYGAAEVIVVPEPTLLVGLVPGVLGLAACARHRRVLRVRVIA